MRTLTLSLLFLALLAPAVYGHNGALSLYTSNSLGDCDRTSTIFMTDTMQFFYVRGSGPDMGNAAAFSLALSSTNVFFAPPPVWSNLITVTLGDVESGISITGSGCLGVGEPVVYLGMVFVTNGFETAEFTVKVVNHPTADPFPGIWITLCEAGQPMYQVLGGTFVFNGTCNPAVEQSSWGAIKSLYR